MVKGSTKAGGHGPELARALADYTKAIGLHGAATAARMGVTPQVWSRAQRKQVSVDKVIDWMRKWNATGGPLLGAEWNPGDGWIIFSGELLDKV